MDKTSDIKSISDMENGLCQEAELKYGDFFTNATDFLSLVNDFINDISLDGWIFTMFLGQFNKHSTLAILSAVRLHHLQGMLNARMALEAGANAAYAIYNRNDEGFIKKLDGDLIEAVSPGKRYKWLEENFKEGSEAMKNLKGLINDTSAHSNMIYAFSNWKMEDKGFHYLLFDLEQDSGKIVKADLWHIANIMMGTLDLFYGVNEKYKLMNFKPDFVARLKRYEAKNLELKEVVMKMPKVKF